MAEHEQVALGPRRTVAPTVEVEGNAAHRVDDEAPVARRVEKQLLRGEGIEHGATDDLRLRVTAGAAAQGALAVLSAPAPADQAGGHGHEDLHLRLGASADTP